MLGLEWGFCQAAWHLKEWAEVEELMQVRKADDLNSGPTFQVSKTAGGTG